MAGAERGQVLICAARRMAAPDAREYRSPAQLVSIHEVPPSRRREYILHFYRPVAIGKERSFLTAVFSLDNETASIWTHVVAFLIFAYRWAIWERIPGTEADRVMERLQLAGSCTSFALSVAYHSLASASPSTYAVMHSLDLLGIVLQVLGFALLGLRVVFGCHELFFFTYACAISAVVPFFLVDFVRALCRGTKLPARTAYAVAALVAFLIIPASHGVYAASPGPRAHIVAGHVQLFAYLGAGFVCWASKFPERLAPGRFDIWFHSHSLWHLGVMASMERYHTSLFEVAAWRLQEEPCSLYSDAEAHASVLGAGGVFVAATAVALGRSLSQRSWTARSPPANSM